MESANKALSNLDLKPGCCSKANSSSPEKIPVWRPVPIKVPSESKVSDKLKDKIVTNTNGIRCASVNKLPIPCEPKAAKNVFFSSATEAPNEYAPERCKSVTPIGMPITVVSKI